MPRSSHSCNDCRYSYLIIGICIPSVDSLKILFGALSEACSAIVTTSLRPGLTLVVQQISQTAIEPSGRIEIISTSTIVVEQTKNVMQQNLILKAWSPCSRNNRITCMRSCSEGLKAVKVSSQSRKFEFKVFSIIHVNGHNF